MNDIDILKLFYESARNELVQRIRLRDSVILLFLAFAGTIFGLALNSNFSNNSEESFTVLLIIPYLSFGATFLLTQHNTVIAQIGEYCSTEIKVELDKLTKPNIFLQWDDSNSLKKISKKAIDYRTFGHFILLLIPPITALSINWKYSICSPFPFGIVWWFGFVIVILSGLLILQVHIMRKRIYKKRWS